MLFCRTDGGKEAGMGNIKLFQSNQIRSLWNEKKQQWYFSIVDVVGALTDSTDGRKYWNKLKQRLKEEGSELVTICHQLKKWEKPCQNKNRP